MSSPIDLLLSRLDNPRPNGRDRWRCACPVCGEKNRSTLSIGIGDSGAVLLRCWKSECSAGEIAASLGLAIEDLFPPRDAIGHPVKRRRMLPAGQALVLLELEMTVAVVVMSDMTRGNVPNEIDRDRLRMALSRVMQLRDEVRQ